MARATLPRDAVVVCVCDAQQFSQNENVEMEQEAVEGGAEINWLTLCLRFVVQNFESLSSPLHAASHSTAPPATAQAALIHIYNVNSANSKLAVKPRSKSNENLNFSVVRRWREIERAPEGGRRRKASHN
jgi:hypothetical protein